MSESDGTNVFSPDDMQSRLMESPSSPGSKENTPSATETPVTKQMDDDKKNIKRKRFFCDALSTQNLDDDSSNRSVKEDSLDINFEEQVHNEKRAKRFRLSLEVPSNDSNSDYTGIGSSTSQEKDENKRKKRFVVTMTQTSDDTYSEVFKSPSQGENIKRKSRFAPPSFVESDDSLLLSNVFKSSSKNKKRDAVFKVPKSPVESEDSVRYSDVFNPISSEEKKKRKPRFAPDHLACSQDTEDSRQYSEIFESVSKNVTKTERKKRFAVPSFQDCGNSLHYSDISVEKKDHKKLRFEDPVSQGTENSLRYSDISILQNDTTADPHSQDEKETSSDKSSASISHSNVVQPHAESIASNAFASKSNYSLHSRNSRSFVGEKSPEPVPTVAQKSPTPLSNTSATVPVQNTLEPVPSTSVATFNNDRFDDTGDALFNFSNSINDIPSRNCSEIPTQAGSYSSRSRNSSSSQTFDSKSSVSVFSISEIGRRRSSAPKEFKVPQMSKIVLKKKRKTDPSFKRLPSRPNFPKFDFYCNKRFYDYLTGKMEPKYGIKTNSKAVQLAKYISDVVREVIAMKTGKHHVLIEEMKRVLFEAGIVTTHYNFYMFCFDYLPPWFRRKAIPMMRAVKCPPNVEFDVSIVFNSFG